MISFSMSAAVSSAATGASLTGLTVMAPWPWTVWTPSVTEKVTAMVPL